MRGAGDETLLREGLGPGQEREAALGDHEGQAGAAREFEAVAQQAEAGDVGDGVDLRIARQIRPDLIEACRGGDEIGVAGSVEGLPA